MKKIFISIAMSLFTLGLSAQELKQFTLEDLNFGGKNYRQMIPKTLRLWWKGHELVNSDTLVKPKGYPQVFVRDHNIFYQTSVGSEPVQITTDGNRQLTYGESVHRNEFGIEGGLFLSPDKQAVAFYRMDQRMVTDYPQVNTFNRVATYEPDSYPMAGMKSHKVTVGIYTFSTGKTVWLDFGDVTDRYFTNICWSPDSKEIYLFEVNRDQTDTSLDVYDSATGKKLRTLYTEHDDKYTEPQNPVMFLPWDSKKFLMFSQKSGYMHLYLMTTEGKMLKQLTDGNFVIQEVLGFCEKTKSVIIATNEIHPLQRNLYSVDIKKGTRTLLDNGRGYHYGILSDDGEKMIDSYSTPEEPRVYDIIDVVKKKRKEFFRSEDPWKGFAVPTFKSGSIKSADGVTDLYYRMVLPPDFDEKKKYPTVVYVYGGPHARNVQAQWHWASRSWETYMAQKGYILFILDNRGSSERGKEFEQVTFRHLGVEEMKDQMCGVDFLKSLPYVDADRMGVHGWSYGGFMTISLMANYPDVFKVGVAGGPVIDWKWYEVMYGERYMDTPEQNPEGYQETSLINKAGNIKGRLQVIIGMNDPTCVPQHTLQFLDACVKAGTQPDCFFYPGEGHNMVGHASVHLHERITRYFDDFLK